MDDALRFPGSSTNASADVQLGPGLQLTKTMTIEERARDLTELAGSLRNRTAITTEDIADVHHRSFRLQLDTHTAELVKRDPVQLLDEVAGLGFAWRDIARMIGVSVPALRRWRLGEKPSGDNRRAIARLLAFTHIITDQVFEPASWMEVPITGDAPTTAIDLYAAGHLDVAFDLATGNCTPEAVLDIVEPGWRDQHRSDWEVATAEDGQPYIKPKNVR
jgi:hypothetical protein